jgi:hypothetical protein
MWFMIHEAGGDSTLPETRRDQIFDCLDIKFDATNDELGMLVYNAGQYEVERPPTVPRD